MMMFLLGVAIIFVVAGVLWWWGGRRVRRLTATHVCRRCGTTRTDVLEARPLYKWRPSSRFLMHGVKTRDYVFVSHPPATDGFTVCRGVGHDWGRP